MTPRLALALSLLLVPGPAVARSVETAGASLDACDAQVRTRPESLDSWWCYCLAAQRTKQWGDAIGRLRAAHLRAPSDPFAALYLATALQMSGGGWDEALLRQAANGFASRHVALGEMRARGQLARLLMERGRPAEAERESEASLRVGRASGDATLIAFAQVQWARTAYSSQNFGQAWRLFHEVEGTIFPDGPLNLQRDVLNGLGNVCYATGRLREALDYYQRQADVTHKAGDLFEESLAKANMAMVSSKLSMAGELSRDRARELTEEALDAAVRSGNTAGEASLRLGLAQGASLDMSRRLEEIDKALKLSSGTSNWGNLCFALRLKALYLSRFDPAHLGPPMRLLDDALGLARARASRHDLARGLHVRSMIEWQTGQNAQALADSLAALDAIERIRDLQRDEEIRVRVFAEWTYVYYRTSGWILSSAGGAPNPEEMDTAFQVAERLRARSLLDTLDAAGAVASKVSEDPAARQRADLLVDVARASQQLNGPTMPESKRAAALEELGRLEGRERKLREQIARADPTFAELRLPSIPSITNVQEALDADQAMLVYQVWQRDVDADSPLGSGGSWLYVITQDTARVLELPERAVFEASVPAFLGLLDRRDGSEARAAASLYHDLLSGAIGGFPQGIQRLIIVPDSVLHHLPFGTLRREIDADPIAATYELSNAPSAALWLRWQRPDGVERTTPALALADPLPDAAEAAGGAMRAATLPAGMNLGPLPLARREARALVRHLGGGSRLLIGAEASERFLKTADLSPYRVLHLAAHAVTDDAHPDRSAVLLSPGSPEEDGLLQIREIVKLDLRGRLVLLSACRSASGALLEGEGILGLARGFFQAGARAVIGSLWPLRDDDAASFVDAFSRHLGAGLSAQAALAATQREMIRSRAPAAAWAGFVVMGDGELVSLPGGRRETLGPTVARLAVASAIALLVVCLLFLSRRRQPA